MIFGFAATGALFVSGEDTLNSGEVRSLGSFALCVLVVSID